MADKTLTDLTATTALVDADTLYVNDGGNSRKITFANLFASLLTKLLANDGVGSLLDADFLDGLSSADFATAAQGQTADDAVQPADLTAGNIEVTPAGDIAATDVQAALEELDDEKLALAGGEMSGAVVGNLVSVITRGAGGAGQPDAGDSGAYITSDGAITIPNTTGWHCTLEFGGDHDVTFNSLVWNTGSAAGDIVSVVVKPSNVIRITPLILAADVITEADFA